MKQHNFSFEAESLASSVSVLIIEENYIAPGRGLSSSMTPKENFLHNFFVMILSQILLVVLPRPRCDLAVLLVPPCP